MNTVRDTSQLTLDFQPGLTELRTSCLDCIDAQIKACGKPLKTIAADMDMSSSELSRKLKVDKDDPRHFTLADLEKYLMATGDTTPILYLAQKYCVSNVVKRDQALSALANMAPQLQALLKAAGVAA
jgi:hypothetical protein